jgi:hypothetical protein
MLESSPPKIAARDSFSTGDSLAGQRGFEIVNCLQPAHPKAEASAK